MKPTLALMALLMVGLYGASAFAQDSVGLNTHVPANDLIAMSLDSRVRWIRVDANWLDMNPARGRFDFVDLDRVADGARARGLRVFVTLAYTPMWVPRVMRARSDTAPQNDEPATSAEWTAFVTAAVTHLRAHGVTHYGLWNEPNLSGFWESEAGADAFIDKILLPGAMAVRGACSDCMVLGPELAHVGDYNVFLDRVLTRAMVFDIVTHHIYQDFPETGGSIFAGDMFVNALETRRFFFTRPALREVLDAHAVTREVWISETGYRASPGDGAAETRQATFVRRVLEEQLTRPWWTNSFFYEITDCGADQPTCDIDGFGITRPLRAVSMGGPRSFPADYRLKPAYTVLRGFIHDHPDIVNDTPRAMTDAGARDASDVSAVSDVAGRDIGPPEVAVTDASGADTPITDVAPRDVSVVDVPVTDAPVGDASVRDVAPPDAGYTDLGYDSDVLSEPSGSAPEVRSGCACAFGGRHTHGDIALWALAFMLRRRVVS